MMLMTDRIFLKDTDVAGPIPSRRTFLLASGVGVGGAPALTGAPGQETIAADRGYWIATLQKIAGPVLQALSERKLKALMPVEAAPGASVEERRQYTYLEALGRLLAGMAPWLELSGGDSQEAQLRQRHAELSRKAIAAAVDPSSPDYMNFSSGAQPVVDAAFLALALLRAPRELWKKLDGSTKQQVIAALQSTRVIRPGFNNWLLFSATIEAFLGWAGVAHDDMRIDYAIRQHEQWYKGDGVYGDGPQFHWDYYNSFVIHPMLLQVIETAAAWSEAWKSLHAPVLARAQRYAAIQERLIGPDGTYPALGRSLAYRCGAFHLLANMALRQQLPASLAPEQVRCALTAVIRRVIEAPSTFSAGGWLNIGLCGHQPEIAERYISTGSLYLCSVAFLPLGLASDDPFWSGASKAWTSQNVWGGKPVKADHAQS